MVPSNASPWAERRWWRLLGGHFLLASMVALAGCVASAGSSLLEQAGALHADAVQSFRKGQYAEGIPKARDALALREQALGAEHPEVASSLQLLAALSRLQGQYAEAEALYRRAAAIREKAFGPTSASVAEIVNHLALLYDAQGRYAEAEEFYARALRIRENTLGPDHPDVAQSLNNLGLFRQDAGDYTAARLLLERALEIWERTLGPNHLEVASALNNLALVLSATADYAEARTRLEQALRIWERELGPNHPEVAQGLNNLGMVLQGAGEYAAARPLLERALQIRRDVLGAHHLAVAQSLTNLGSLSWFAGDHAAARRLAEDAVAVWEQAVGPDHPHVAIAVHNLARVLESTGDLPGARRRYERALALEERTVGADHPNVAFTVHRLARLDHLEGDYTAAERLYARALRVREARLGPKHPMVAHTLSSLADLLRDRGDHAGAEPLYDRALQIARDAATPEWEWRAAFGQGAVYERGGRLLAALANYRQALATLEQLVGQFEGEGSRVQYLQGENRLAVYDALARLLLKLHEREPTRGYDREAWAVLEARKGRIAAEALTAARPRFQNEAAQRVQARRDQVRSAEQALTQERAKPPAEQRGDRIEHLTRLVARTKAGYLAEVQVLLARYPQYKAQFADQQLLDPRALAKFADRLPPGTFAVQYFATPDALYVFVVAPDLQFQVRTRDVSQRELYTLVRAYRRHLEEAGGQPRPWLEDGSPEYQRAVLPFKELTRALAAHLLGPIESELRTHSSVILIPNDLLLYLPIHALTYEPPDGGERFLAETHATSYLTQLELVSLLAPQTATRDAPLLALGNPDGSLPGASQEIRMLTKVRPSVTTLEGSQATKARFLGLAPVFLDLHLATHGVFDLERPERSYLLMAGEEERSQRLSIGEIAGLSLQNGLAVLSACDTALGEQVPGAALITLAAAFSQAGAQSIVASLWRVDDEATRDFMATFHRALRRVGVAAALREAQITLLRDPSTAHPYYWGAFLLMGAR